MSVPTGARAFDANAAGYEATVARTLEPVARRVVASAQLAPGEVVLDIGTGPGTAAGFAVGAGRTVFGIDAAPAMIERALRNVADATFQVMDFSHLEFPDATFDAVLASHALLFAEDRIAALREWLRVARPGARLSISVPGPESATPTALYGDVYERHGVVVARRFPSADAFRADVEAAGWIDARVDADPTIAIRLASEELFRVWRTIGTLAEATRDWSAEQHEALTAEMLSMTPRDPDGTFVIPFGALFLTARRPAA